MDSGHPPSHAQILIIGGGPAGSYAASTLAREGFQVILFESAVFPRYHVGESLIPAVRHHLRFIGAEEKIANAGFMRKPGAAMKFTQHKREGYTDFAALGSGNSVWNVCRADFDSMLLDHAREQGALVFQRTRVTGVVLDDNGHPVSATYTTSVDLSPSVSSSDHIFDNQHTVTFDYLIDATGRAGLLSNCCLKTRKFNSALRNVATWGYWRGAGVYGRGTSAEGAPWFEALTDESGWAWFIPLAGNITSVGFVRSQKANTRSRSNSSVCAPPPYGQTPIDPRNPGEPSTPQPLSFSPGSPASDQSSFTAKSLSTAPTTPPPGSPPHSKLVASAGAVRRSTIRPSILSSLPSEVFCSTPSADSVFSPGGSMTFPRQAQTSDGVASSVRQRYLACIPLAPGLQELLGDAELVPGGNPSDSSVDVSLDSTFADDFTVRSASDFSYSASSYAGSGYRIIGDAGAFIDPFFSSGVHLAMNSALSAATSIAASIRGDCDEKDAAEWHTARVSVSYTRFLIVVLSAYKQMRSQSEDVLTDIGEDRFENAFKALRPVIHGNADLGPRLSEKEVQNALDFCTNLFIPTSPEQHASVRARFMASEQVNVAIPEEDAFQPITSPPPTRTRRPGLGNRARSGTIERVLQWLCRNDSPSSPSPEVGAPSAPRPGLRPRRETAPALSAGRAEALFDVRTPVLQNKALDAAVAALLPAADVGGEAEVEARNVLHKINARRIIHREFGGTHSLEEEVLGSGGGWRVRLERGRLGLMRADVTSHAPSPEDSDA